MNVTNVIGLVLMIAGFLVLPGVSADHATPWGPQLCNDNTVNQDYEECNGMTENCGDGGATFVGFGHTYEYEGSEPNPPAGQSGGWCWVYVATGSGSILAICTESEFHVYDDCIVTVG